MEAKARLVAATIAANPPQPQPKVNQDELPTRFMQDSFCRAVIPIKEDKKTRKKYLTVFKSVRFGRLLEDMDSFAGWICYKHIKAGTPDDWYPPYSLVTAGVDRIMVRQESVHGDADILMEGKVTWVGRSSMEATIHLLQNNTELLEAKFVMVALGYADGKSAVVNGLKLTTPEEERLFKAGDGARLKRQKDSENSLLKVIPRGDEVEDIHNMFLETLDQRSASFRVRIRPPNSVWMEDTILKSALMCHPEERNIYGKIFGGFLMRQSYELGYMNALTFGKSRPMILSVDDIHFRCPVPIGSLLYLSSQVGFSCQNKMQVKVHAEVVDPVHNTRNTTNIFHFTFASQEPVPVVVPKTYAEAMIYIDSRRHFRSIFDGPKYANCV